MRCAGLRLISMTISTLRRSAVAEVALGADARQNWAAPRRVPLPASGRSLFLLFSTRMARTQPHLAKKCESPGSDARRGRSGGGSRLLYLERRAKCDSDGRRPTG